MQTPRLEASVTHSICTQLENLGWIVNESHPDNNVTQQRPKTEEQKELIRQHNLGSNRFPDFVLYQKGTAIPIAVIEAKRPGESLEQALEQAENRYARPLGAPLIFAYNDTFVDTRHIFRSNLLKIDGEDVRQFVDHYTSLRFVNEGPEILSAPTDVQVSREELIRVFKRQANLLREAGLTAGLVRFGAFSDIIFLKLMDELCQLREHSGEEPPLPASLRWSEFENKNPQDRLEYVRGYVWSEMRNQYGNIFGHEFPIHSAEIFDDIIKDISSLNFTVTDVDVKGDAFEYFLKNAYQGINIKDLGEYFTPRNIVRTMVSMVDPKIGEKVYDPFCGTGGFLIEAFRYISLRTRTTGNDVLSDTLRRDTVYGSEISATARVARMNMILYGDGHSNVREQDSFANPQHECFDVILTNPPYSQSTRYGNLYPITSQNGDAIAMQHCLKALKPDGRGAILVKEDFLTKSRDSEIGKVRDWLLSIVKNITVVSLPRRLFEPYTPTKTSIIYFEKAGTRDRTFFFVVENVGHTLGARKRSTPDNDLPHVLDNVRTPEESFTDRIDSLVVDNSVIRSEDSSLWIYDYKEVLPPGPVGQLQFLGDHIRRSGERFQPSETPDVAYSVLGVSNTSGVYLNEIKHGHELGQPYVRVHAGDLVYNPHRVNVGSLGLVPLELDGGIVSGIYIVFRPLDCGKLPSSYLYYLLKSEPYLRIIRAYDSKHGAVRANLNWEQLKRIRIAMPDGGRVSEFMTLQARQEQVKSQYLDTERDLINFVIGD